MKKKSMKKLVLSKETVRSLEAVTLNRVAGGETITDCNACTFEASCPKYCLDEPITYGC